MGGLAGIASVFSPQGGTPLPPLPGNLGLPQKANPVGIFQTAGRDHDRAVNNSGKKKYVEELAKANEFNRSFVELLNQQSHLNGAERKQVYDAYYDKFASGFDQIDNTKGLARPIDFSKQLSQLTPEQFAAQRRQEQQAVAPTPAPAPAPAPTPQAPAPTPTQQAPQTTGPAAQTVGPVPATPTVATPTGNIAGKTTTTGGTESSTPGSSRKQRGRVATLLTGLGGALERFGA